MGLPAHRIRSSAAVRWSLIGAGILLVGWSLLVLAERNSERLLVRFISARTSRQIQIGSWDAHLLSSHPTIKAGSLSIGNPVWLPAGTTAEVGTVSLYMRWRLALHPLAIERLVLEDARWHLIRDPEGRANWHLREEGPGKGPPLMRSLSMPNARVDLRDERRHLMFNGTVSAGDAGSGPAPSALRVEGSGELNGHPVSFTVDADPLADVRPDHAYHFDLVERSSGSRLTGHGYLLQPFNFQMLQGNFEASGDDLKDVYYLVGLTMPDTGPYHLSGQLARQGKHFVYSQLKATSGSSDMNGTVSVDGSGKRPRLTVVLNSRRIRLADFGRKAAGRAAEPASPVGLRIPDTPLRVSGLQRSDVELDYGAAEVELGTHLLHALTGRMKIERGQVSMESFAAAMVNGKVEGHGRLDTSRPEAPAEVSLKVSALQLADWQHAAQGDEPIDGDVSARAELTGHGLSLHELAASASGRVVAVLSSGSIRASIVKSASLELEGMLGLLFKSRKRTVIHCGIADLQVHDGIVTAGPLLLDSDAALVSVTGNADLRSESLDFVVHGVPRSAALRLKSALTIGGNMRHPKIKLTGYAAGSQSPAPLTAGSQESLASGLAFVSPELAHGSACLSIGDQPHELTPQRGSAITTASTEN